jgi:hypothetical protein
MSPPWRPYLRVGGEMSLWSILWACGGQKLEVELPDAEGLQQGARVWVAGVDVGEVSEVGLAGDQVRVAVTLDAGHDLLLHQDACAVIMPQTPPALHLWPGTEGRLAGPVGPCQITREDLEDLARAAGETVSGMAREFAEGTGLDKLLSGRPPGLPVPPVPPGPGIALPSLQAPPELCARVRVAVERIEPVPAGFFLPQGGYTLHLLVTNDNAIAVDLPGSSEVALLSRGRELSPVTLPDRDNWFMSVSVGPGSSRALQLVAPAELGRDGGTLDGIRIPSVEPADCTVQASFQSR